MKINKALKNVILAGSIISTGALSTSALVFAGAVDGKGGTGTVNTNGNGNIGGNCDSKGPGFTIYCEGWSWVYYKYVGGDSYKNQEFFYTPRFTGEGVVNNGVNSYDDPRNVVAISGECAQEGSGFWHLGRNIQKAKNTANYYDLGSNQSFTYGSITYSNVVRLDDSGLGNRDGILTDSGSIGHYTTFNYATLTNIYANQAEKSVYSYEHGADGAFGDNKLSHVLIAGTHPVYQATKYGKHEDVELDYFNQVMHGNKSSYDSLTDEEKSSIISSENIGTTIYFCAYEDGGKKDEYTPEVELKINLNGDQLSTKIDVDIQNNGGSNKVDDGQVHTASSQSIVYNAYGKTTSVNSVQTKTKYKVTALPSNETTGYIDSNGFSNGPTNASTLSLMPGVVYEICAENSYYSTWSSGGGYTDEKKISACTHVVYNMPCDDSGINQTITSSNQYNYGRIQTTANGRTISAGDINNDTSTSFTDSNSMFSQPTKMSVSYYGCMGGQAAKDGGSGGETKYQILSTPTPRTDQLFNSTKNYIDLTSKAAQSISSTELGLGWPQGADDATVNNRITAKYQFNPSNASTTQLKLAAGRTYKNQLIWYRDTASTDKKTATNEVKVPYNYVLKPIASSSSDILTVGSTYTASGEIKKTGRNNAQTNASEETAPTDIKVGTRSFVALFAVSDGQNASNLQQKLNSFSSHVAETDEYYYNDSSDSPLVRISGLIDSGFTIMEKDFEVVQINKQMEKDGIIENPATDSNALTYTVKSGEKIGTKICSMVAVYPADSHNTHDGNINSNDQSVALTDAFGSNAYWSFKVSCATVGKSPTTSIEGNSLVTGGGISVSTKTYNGRTFGSWAEYDISSTSIGGPMGSGASMAYDNSQKDKNLVASLDASGLASGNFVSPQTLGNTGTLLGTSDSSRILADSKKYVENMIGTFYDEDSKIIAENADKAPELEFRYPEKKDVLIDTNIENYSNDTVVVIYGKNVHIAKNVTRIDALIIADGEFDTCSSGIGSDAYEQDAGGTFENQVLLENCGNELVINGAVYAKTIDLDRTYGGGSVTSEDTVNPETLMQRAEVFSYDPRVVKAVYDYLSGLKTLNNTFEKEIAPRY